MPRVTPYDIADVVRDRMAGQRRIPLLSVQASETEGVARVTFRLKDGSVVIFEEVGGE